MALFLRYFGFIPHNPEREFYLRSGGGTPNTGTYRGSRSDTTAYASGDKVHASRSATASAKFYIYECVTGGTTAGSEPTWVDTPGSSTTDGTVTWICRSCNTWEFAHMYLDMLQGNHVANDIIYVSKNHNEVISDITATLPLTWNGQVFIICVDDTGDPVPPTALATGAKITCNSYQYQFSYTNPNARVYLYGIYIASDNSISFDAAESILENCTLERTGINGEVVLGCRNIWKNVWLKGNDLFQIRRQGSRAEPDNYLLWDGGGLLEATSIPYYRMIRASIGLIAILQNLDFTYKNNASTSVIFKSENNPGTNPLGTPGFCGIIKNSVLPSGWSGSVFDAVGSNHLHNAVDLSMFVTDDANTNYRYEAVKSWGEIKSDANYFHTNGASDGVTSISWKMTSFVNAAYRHALHASPEIQKWNSSTGSSLTATVEILHDSATPLTDKDIWLEVSYLGTSGYTLGAFADDMGTDYFGSGTNQTTSSVSWNGTGGMSNPNKQKLEVTFTPQHKGLVVGVVKLAKPSYTVYVDPKMTIA